MKSAWCLASAVVSAPTLGQPCTPKWIGEFNTLMGEGNVLALHDPDGPGPAPGRVFVAGDLVWARPHPQDVLHFAVGMWDGRDVTSAGQAGTEALLDHDADGPGPGIARLYAAGWRSVRVWEGGEQWTPVGPAFGSLVTSLTSWDPDGDGPADALLVAGGDFTSIGDSDVLRIAAWDGEQWSPIGEGFNGPVLTVAAIDDDGDGVTTLVAGGDFTGSGGTHLGPVARWSGGAWQAFPGEFSPPRVSRLAAYDEDGPGPLNDRLYAAGDFHSIDGVVSNHIARFDGTAWAPLGDGLDASGLDCLRVLDTDGPGPVGARLYVGSHTGANWYAKGRIDAWDGEEWVAPEWTPTNPAGGDGGFWVVRDLLLVDPDGDGPLAGQLVVTGLLPSDSGWGRAMASWHDGRLWTVGDGLGMGAAWVLGGYAFCAAPWDRDGAGPEPGAMMVGGGFEGYLAGRAGGRTFLAEPDLCCLEVDINWIWVPIVASLLQWDDDGHGARPPGLYAGFGGTLRGFPGQQIMRLDAGGWSSLGSLPTPIARAMAVFDDDGAGPRTEALYAGGEFDQCGGIPAHNVARWDGQAWEVLGAGTSGSVYALAVFDGDGEGPARPALFAGGHLSSAGGLPVNRIARWDGAQWSDVAGGVSIGVGAEVHSLCVYDEDGEGPAGSVLIVGGQFAQAGSSPAKNLARWDGAEWSEVGGGIGPDDYDNVRALAVLDDDGAGARPAGLFVGGSFRKAGGAPAASFARWDGETWERPPGLWGTITAMSPIDEDGDGPLRPVLYVAGALSQAGDLPALCLARWGCDEEQTCFADCDGSGALDVMDYLCFAEIFAAGSNAADCDASGGLDLFDFLCFVNAFHEGC
jgi:hypothetical protein